MNPILAAWIAEAIIITYRGTRQAKFKKNPVAGLALPSEYVATVIVFGGLSLIPQGGDAGRIASTFAWGLMLATTLNLWNPGSGVTVDSPNLEPQPYKPATA